MKESYLTLNIGEEDHEATLNYIRSRNSENTDFCDLIDLKEYNVHIPLTKYGPSRILFDLDGGANEEENKITCEADIIQDECLHDIINLYQNKTIFISKSYVNKNEIKEYDGFEYICTSNSEYMFAFKEIEEYEDQFEFEHYIIGLANFIVFILNEKTKQELNELKNRKTKEIMRYIIDNMFGFYCDVYDGESYIIGIRK